MNAQKLEQELQLFKSQLSSFHTRGTQSSATRARAHLLNIKKECDTLRKQLLSAAKEKKAAKTARVAPTPHPSPEPEPSEPVSTEPEPVPEELPKPVKKKTRKVKKRPM